VGRTASIIPLPDSEDAAWDNLKSTARNRIRKAQGLTVQHGMEYLNRWWPAYAENMYMLGAPVLSKRFFRALPNAHMIVLEQNGEVVAGMVLVNFKDVSENGWTSSTAAARDLYANDLLYWEAIRWTIAQGYAYLDLGRSEAGSGHERFKEKFNAQTVALPYQEMAYQDGAWQAVTEEPTRLYDLFRMIWGKLPVGLATYLGPYVSRQVY
jgi:hypothetical protein